MVGEQTEWGYTEHLLATVVDALQIANWLFASAHSKHRVDRPNPLPRPGARRRADVDGARTLRMLEAWRSGDLVLVETAVREVS